MLPTESISRLKAMPDREREAALGRLSRRGVEPRVEVVAIQARIAAYETRHQMTTEMLRIQLRDGSLKESSEASAWLFLDEALKDLR